MLTDKELDKTAAKLADLRVANERHHETLSEALSKYTTLMEDYKRLKSDYEEERDARERYKQLARGQGRNPFVLVLIDGDGYIFDDDLVSNGAEGGQKAAKFLNDAVKNSLRGRGLDHCRIMVRVYANLAGLSKALSKAKLAGPEKRSLAPFVASFTRSNDLFDFVDAGELKENADFKIRAMFRQFVENAQCRHIYFAGCHDVGYLAELTPYTGNRDRITLVRATTFHHEFSKLGMRVEDFSNIFRAVPLEGPAPQKTPPPLKVEEPTMLPTTDGTSAVCTFYQKGMCKYGKSCRFLHVKANGNGTASGSHAPHDSLSDIKDWRQNAPKSKSTNIFQMSDIPRSDNDFMSGLTLDPDQLQIDFATSLPQANRIPKNEIPVNKSSHRLDAYIPPPTNEDKHYFHARVSKLKLCNNHHINGSCPLEAEDCGYDHTPVSPGVFNCLKQVVSNNPCPRKGSCRSLNCMHGHICQRAECRFRGGKLFCKFSPQTHTVDLSVSEYVQGIGGGVTKDEDAASSVATGPVSSDDISHEQARSRGSLSSPMAVLKNELDGNSDEEDDVGFERDMEADTEQGALLDVEDDTHGG